LLPGFHCGIQGFPVLRNLSAAFLVQIGRRLPNFATALLDVLGAILRPVSEILSPFAGFIGNQGARFVTRTRRPKNPGRYSNAES
jgi:hypothetical protein